MEAAIAEGGTVRDSASEEVKRTRARVATVEARLRGALAKHEGEISMHAGRMCVAVSTGAIDCGLPRCTQSLSMRVSILPVRTLWNVPSQFSRDLRDVRLVSRLGAYQHDRSEFTWSKQYGNY
jgi:hypothetical protein